MLERAGVVKTIGAPIQAGGLQRFADKSASAAEVRPGRRIPQRSQRLAGCACAETPEECDATSTAPTPAPARYRRSSSA